MNDDERTLLIYRALDEELDPDEAERLRRLVRHSSEARTEFDALQDMRALIAEHGGDTFDPGFASRVMENLPERSRQSDRAPAQQQRSQSRWSWSLPRLRIGWAFAAVLVVVGIGLVLSQWPRTVHVPRGETEVATLPDGSTAELSAGSTLRYAPFWSSSTRQVTLNGEAFFDVAEENRPFVVETFNAHVVVKGTRFNVRAWEDDPVRETTVTLASGRVDVVPNAPAADTLALSPGETSVVADDTSHTPTLASIPLERALSWRSGGLAFVDQPLGSALRTLERRFDIRIQLADDNLADRPLTYLNPQPESVASVLSDVCHVLDLRYRRTTEGYVVQRK